MKKYLALFFICLGAAVFAETPFQYHPLNLLSALSGSEGLRTVADEPILNNKHLMESVRANNLAKLAFEDGDYDLSIQFSADAIRAARLSDELIAQKLKIAEANKKIDEARDRLGWADASKARVYAPNEYNNAKAFYNQALVSRNAGEWSDALNSAINAIAVLADLRAPPVSGSSTTTNVSVPLPAQYTVRPWDTFGDCLWNIAGRPWAYGDPYRWPLLYRANKTKLPDPDNPNLIEPGMILDIPSLRGEIRQGMWDSGRRYEPLR